MNLKTAKKYAGKIMSGLFTQAKKQGVDKATIDAIGAKATKLGAVGKLAKFLTPLVEINMIDSFLGEIPIIKELWAGVGQFSDWLSANTVEKIPGIGPINQKVRRGAQKFLVPKAMKYVNDPKYYENTDMHQAWNIPFNFPDTDLLDFGSGIEFASVCIIELGYNYLADEYAVKSRNTQVFDLLKGIRGLSGKQPYSVGDLYYYRRNVEYLVNEYCRLKFALRLSQMYILTKSRMPYNVLSALGWNPDDFITNKALYISALTDMGNFITNNVPAFGTQIKRIYGLWEKLIPDSDDHKVALFYKVNLHIHTLIPESNNTYDQFGDAFQKGTVINPGTTSFNINGLNMSGMTYSIYMSNMLGYMKLLMENDQFNPIRADIIASFGASSIWTDKYINQVNDSKFDDIIGPCDELFLSQIQNATILEARGFDYLGSGTISNTTISGIDQSLSLGSQNTDGSYPFPTAIGGNNANIVVGYEAANTTGSAKSIYLPQFDGAADITTNSYIGTDSTIVVANKYDMKESEQIELIQLMAFANGKTAGYDSSGRDLLNVAFITNTFFVESMKILYFSPVTKTDNVTPLCGRAVYASAGGGSYTELTLLLRATQFWSQADYGPKVPYTCYRSDVANSTSGLLLDFNIMGSISRAAFKQEIRYSTYSLTAADIRITEAKKLNNIVNVYSMK